jgi:hypothetical protein
MTLNGHPHPVVRKSSTSCAVKGNRTKIHYETATCIECAPFVPQRRHLQRHRMQLWKKAEAYERFETPGMCRKYERSVRMGSGAPGYANRQNVAQNFFESSRRDKVMSG